jgi:hypothetical protein
VPDVTVGARFLPHGGAAQVVVMLGYLDKTICVFSSVFFSNGMESKVEEDNIFELLYLSEISSLAEAGLPTL